MKTMAPARWVAIGCIALASLTVIPATGRAAEDKPSIAQAPAAKPGKIDINTATVSDLEALPGIGAEFADAVIAQRPYKSVEDLKRVPGFTEAKIQALRDMLVASPVPPPSPQAPNRSNTATPSRPPQVNDGRAQ